jgi:hypothetical protein
VKEDALRLTTMIQRSCFALIVVVLIAAGLSGCAKDLEPVVVEIRPFGTVAIPVAKAKEGETTTVCVEPGMLVKWHNTTPTDQMVSFESGDKLVLGIASIKIAADSWATILVPDDAPADSEHSYEIVIGDLSSAEYLERIKAANEEAEREDPEWIYYGGPALIVCPPGSSPCN